MAHFVGCATNLPALNQDRSVVVRIYLIDLFKAALINMKREDITFMAAALISWGLAGHNANCISGWFVAGALNVLMIFPLTMVGVLIPYLVYFVAGKKEKFPFYYHVIALILVSFVMVSKHYYF